MILLRKKYSFYLLLCLYACLTSCELTQTDKPCEFHEIDITIEIQQNTEFTNWVDSGGKGIGIQFRISAEYYTDVLNNAELTQVACYYPEDNDQCDSPDSSNCYFFNTKSNLHSYSFSSFRESITLSIPTPSYALTTGEEYPNFINFSLESDLTNITVESGDIIVATFSSTAITYALK